MHMKIVYCLLVLHVRTYLFFCLTPGKWHPPISFATLYYLRVAPASYSYTVLQQWNSVSSQLTFGLSRFIQMQGGGIEYLALSLWPLQVKHSPTPTCRVAMRHCPLARLSSWSMARALCAGTWRDDTKNRKNASSQGFCTPRCHLCDRHNSDECSGMNLQQNSPNFYSYKLL